MSDDSSQQTSLNDIVDEYTKEPDDESVDAGKIQEIDESPVEGWELRRLGEVFSLEYGENLTEGERDGGQNPVYGSNGQVGSHSEPYVNRPGIIVGRKGSIGEVEFSEEPFYPIDTTYYISQKETDENLRFVYYLLENIQLSRLNAASAIPGLNRNDTYSLKGLVPPLHEQRKIASVLYTIDQATQKTNEIIEAIKRLKRGTLQDAIFDVDAPTTTERRFGPMVFKIPEDWDRVRLQDVTTLVTRGKQPTYAENGIPVINQECIYWDDFYFENIRYLDEDVGNDWKEKYFPNKGDVLINSTGQGTLGRAQVYRDDTTRAVDSHVTIVRPDTEQMTPGYFRYLLESNRGQGLLYSMCVSGSTGQIELSKSKLQLLSIPLPPIEEQREIVGSVERFDQNIRKQQEYREQLRRLKQGLMQDLLTGEVRTVDRDINILPEVENHG